MTTNRTLELRKNARKKEQESLNKQNFKDKKRMRLEIQKEIKDFLKNEYIMNV